MLLVGLVLTAGLLAAGCGGDDSTSSDSGISEDEQAALVDGCQQAIDSTPSIDSETGDELISKCQDAAASSDSLEEASQTICVETAVAVGKGAVSEAQAQKGCEGQLPQ